MIEPSQARYRMAVAFQRLANALGVQLSPVAEDCECLERLAAAAEWLAMGDKPTIEDIEEDLEERVREEIADDRAREDWEKHSE